MLFVIILVLGSSGPGWEPAGDENIYVGCNNVKLCHAYNPCNSRYRL